MNELPRPIRIGVSSCLLGESVRFDGGHKRDDFLTGTLGRFVEWVPVCPEVECGLGTPREPMQLVRADTRMRLITVKTGVDLTAQLEEYARHRVSQLAAENLSGYVLKKDSPSCGLEHVKVYDRHGVPTRSGRGLFAARLLEHFPDLPIEEEGRLSDHRRRENFVERVFAYRRLRSLFGGRWELDALIRFHTAHKLILMAHSPQAYRQIGRLVAGARQVPRQELERRYTRTFMAALTAIATPGRHANVLQHMAGYFKNALDPDRKADLIAAIDEYRREIVPLSVPLTLFRHHLRVHDVAYLTEQLYLEPHPEELMLRNHP